jgi:hypothetical protein
MANVINATSTGNGGLVSTGDDSGILNIQTNETTAITVDASQNVSFTKGFTVGSTAFPTFSAYQSTQQPSLTSNVTTLLQFQTEEWDTGGCFNNTGSTVTLNGVSAPQYSFAPNVAGYYQISAGAAVASSIVYMFLSVYKNGSLIKRLINTNTATVSGVNGSALVYCNGTSDYIQIYLNQGGNQQLVNALDQTYFQAVMVRSA